MTIVCQYVFVYIGVSDYCVSVCVSQVRINVINWLDICNLYIY